MKNLSCQLALVCLVIAGHIAPVSAQTSASQMAAERRGKELAAVITTGDRAEFRKFVSANFGAEMLRLPMAAHLTFLSQLYDGSRGLVFHSIQEWGPNQATTLLQNQLTGGWLRLNVIVEPEEPYRILGARFLPGASPEPFVAKLSARQIGRELDSFMRKLADADAFSGAVLLAQDGVEVFKGAYGMANKDFNAPNRIDTKFNLGSMNKMFTAVAIMQLVEAGRLSLDDPLSKFLPDFPDEASAQRITVEHLLTHTAGLGNFFGRRFQESSKTLFFTVDDLLKFIAADEKLLFDPGSRWQYSNTGFLVLGKVIETVTKQPYNDYVRANIFEPAGMLQTDAYSLDRVNSNLAVGYDKQFTDEGIVFRNNLFVHFVRGGPAGGGYSTVEDILRFDRALRSHELLEPEIVQQMLSPKPKLNSPNYGYGFDVNSELSIAGHSGGFTGINSQLDMFLDSGWTAVVLSNYTNGGAPVWNKIRELVSAAE